MPPYGRVEKVRLLVVDDDPPTADLVATVARYEGGEAVPAHSGEEALRRAAAFRPDIVVLDVMLPDVDGFGVLDRLRGFRAMLPVVFLTARQGARRRHRAEHRRTGADGLHRTAAVRRSRSHGPLMPDGSYGPVTCGPRSCSGVGARA